MLKKILLISPVPSHPHNEGNRVRIYRLLMNLQAMGNDVYFVYIKQEVGDEEAMKKCWGNNFSSIDYKRPKTAFKKRPQKISDKIIRRIKAIFDSDPYFTYSVDDWYDNCIDRVLKELSRTINPDVVIVEYVFLSKALECFGNNVLKTIDTHDLFTDRYKLYLKNKQQPQWFSTTRREEKKGLSRADVIIAIQQKEAAILSRFISNKKIITIGHLVDLYEDYKDADRQLKNRILFVGSRNPINVNGIKYFISEVFPKLRNKMPDVQLILVGDVCDVLESCKGCIKLGRLSNLKDAYDMADVVVSPILFGTGLKIKNIEALGYSKPLVTTPAGAEGLEKAAGKAFLVAESPQQFLKCITEVLSNNNLYRELSKNAYEFAKAWNQDCLKVLQKAFY